MVEFSWTIAGILFISTMATSFVGTLTGGAGILMVPLCIFFGFPVDAAVATTRVGSFSASIFGISCFWRNRNVDYKIGLKAGLIACLGAYFGSSALLLLPDNVSKRLIGFLMLFIYLVSYFKKRSNHLQIQDCSHRHFIGYLVFFMTGCFGGAFGGQGVLILSALSLLFEKDLLTAVGTRFVISLMISVCALWVYIRGGVVAWNYAAVFAISAAVGTYFGAQFSIKQGAGILTKIFEIIIILSSIRLLFF